MLKRCMGCMELYEESARVCPHCGYAEGSPTERPLHLIPGGVLHDRYIVGRALGSGGFGVT